MGANALNRSLQPKAGLMVLLMLLMTVPLIPTSAAADIGDASKLQAQDIAATFDPVSETTTITWRNIETFSGSNVANLQNAEYTVYRHSEPITSGTIGAAIPFANVTACIAIQSVDCLAPIHPGHTASYLVGAGVNDTYFYAITTSWTESEQVYSSSELDLNASSLYEGVHEVTSPVETPIFFQAEYSLADSETTLTWYNYHDLPNSDPAMPDTRILVWRSDGAIGRDNGGAVYEGLPTNYPVELLANLSSENSEYVNPIPSNTNRESYYAITYFIPNGTESGVDKVDLRFLSGNALITPILEDNLPPSQITDFNAYFVGNVDGTGTTTLSWSGSTIEDDERYEIYVAGDVFSSIFETGPSLVASIPEKYTDISEEGEPIEMVSIEEENIKYEYTRNLPVGSLGLATYCIVLVDEIGLFNANTSSGSCSTVQEDAYSTWEKEPSNVHAEFIGDRTIRVTWTDQLGVEGERYHVYSASGFQPSPQQFATATTYHGFANDNVETFDIVLNESVVSPNGAVLQWYIYVTSEAQYVHTTGSYEYIGLNNNSFGPVTIDITTPTNPSIVDAESRGDLGFVALEWYNLQESNEAYQVWRHTGDPFNGGQTSITSSDADGWELVLDDINVGEQNSATIIRNIPLASDTEREVWYAVTVADEFNNTNSDILEGLSGNSFLVREDTLAPSVELRLLDDENSEYTSPSLIAGTYTIKIEASEELKTTPSIEVVSDTGFNVTGGGEPMTQIADNLLNPDKGPEYSYSFTIPASANAGAMTFEMTLIDDADNIAITTNTNYHIDAKGPTVTIYSPSSSSEGSKYLYGNKINLMFAAEDDVQIQDLQYRFTFNYGGLTGITSTSPWADAEGITDVELDMSTLVSDMDFSAGTFDAGQHAITVRGIDTAGNEVSQRVVFVVDFCRNNLEGETICTFEEDLKEAPEPEQITPSMSDPPYLLVWIAVAVNILLFIVALTIVQTSMAGPKKKKAGEEEDEDWMSEFIGTSQDLDMDAITGTGSTTEPENEEKKAVEAEPEPEADEDDPFAVNLVQRKTRRKKEVVEEIDEDEAEGIFWDDDDDDDEEEDEEPAPRKRPVRKRPTRKAPTRKRPVRRKANDD
jgi:flagellar basal body-associated protein FliL